MRIAIYCGSFDPPHLGHLILSCCALEEFNLDKIIFVPSFLSVNKQSHFASSYDRVMMLKLLLKDYPLLSIDQYEVNQKRAVFTFETITYLKEKYRFKKEDTFLCVGADWIENLDKWKNFDFIRNNLNFLVFSRNNLYDKILAKFNDLGLNEDEFLILKRNIDISSSEIRRLIKENRQFSHFLTESVFKYIIEKGLYL